MPETETLIRIYECLCDETRLRILHLLAAGPLCVCHFQEILGEPQVKISKHLAYLRERGLAEVERHQNWMIYSLPRRRTRELEANLRCLQDCARTNPAFKADARKLRAMRKDLAWLSETCCPEPRGGSGAQKEGGK